MRKSLGHRGFSFTELMVSSALGAVVVAGATYWFLAGAENRRLNLANRSLLERERSAQQLIREPLNQAARVTGFSVSTYPGIFNRVVSSGSEELRVFQMQFSEIQSRISVLSISASDPRQIQFQLNPALPSGPTGTPDATPEQVQQHRSDEVMSAYMDTALAQPRWVIFKKGEYVNILPVFQAGTKTQSAFGTVTGPFMADLTSLPPSITVTEIAREIDSETYVMMAKEVLFRIDESSLVREEVFRTRELVRVLPNVSRLEFRFDFHDALRAELQRPSLMLPNRTLTRADASDYHQVGFERVDGEATQEACDPTNVRQVCVNGSDISIVRVSIDHGRQISFRKAPTELPAQVSYQDGLLTRRSEIQITPAAYSADGMGDSGQGVDISCMAPNMRCKPACADFFNDPNPRSPRWVGYGQYVGRADADPNLQFYCRCGTPWASDDPDGFIPPETPAGRNAVPNYRPPLPQGASTGNPQNAQINACIAHFGNLYDWAWKHAAMWTWWNGLQYDRPTHYREVVVDQGTGYTWYRWNWDRFRELYDNYMQFDIDSPSAYWDDDFECRLRRDYISGVFREIFYSTAPGSQATDETLVLAPVGRPAYGPPASSSPGRRLAAPLEEKCLCDVSGAWNTNEVCNYRANPNSPVCPNLWGHDPEQDGTVVGDFVPGTEALAEGLRRKVFRVNGSGTPLNGNPAYTGAFVSPAQAAVCQCLNETYNPPYFPSASRLPTASGWGSSGFVDFRVNPSDPVFQSSVSQVGSDIFTGTNPVSPSVPLVDIASAPINFDMSARAPWDHHWGRAWNSYAFRTVHVHYRTHDGESIQVAGPFACHGSSVNQYLDRCLRRHPHTQQSEWDSIRANLMSVRGTTGLTEAQVDQYTSFCTRRCWNEQTEGPGTQDAYTWMGIRAIRQKITGSSSIDQIPLWCGGRVSSGQPTP